MVWLFPIGFFAGAFGTLIGAGGGFVLLPLLLLLYPEEAPETVTSISLAAVFFNALSATFAYARAKRIDYRSAAIFSIASSPGAVLGALATSRMSRSGFDILFGSILVLVAIFLAINPGPKSTPRTGLADFNPPTRLELKGSMLAYGTSLSMIFGFISSFLGIGGGFLYVPALIFFLRFPVHNATATSLCILTLTAFTGSATHMAAGLFHQGMRRVVVLSVGAILGAQVGAKLSDHLRGEWIARALALTLALAGFRIIGSVF
ncbi:MAG TPA: sulfite exporter TauE/SafE family protein [Candidatus Eisenbacteria bacterium]|nr:sulfite exporter TauE/SafE family protein [Candidatus Eisenbacteria bacterium]